MAATVLLPEVCGRTAFIRRISDPEEVPGVLDPDERDDSVVLMEAALGARVKAPLTEIRHSVFDAVADEYLNRPVSFCRTLTEVHLWSALAHWLSPFGLDFRAERRSDSLLLYRGNWYLRTKGGRLSWLRRDESQPDFSQWCSSVQFAQILIGSGLLREDLS